MILNSFDPVFVTEGIALNVPLTLTIAGLLIATVATAVVAAVRKLKRRSTVPSK